MPAVGLSDLNQTQPTCRNEPSDCRTFTASIVLIASVAMMIIGGLALLGHLFPALSGLKMHPIMAFGMILSGMIMAAGSAPHVYAHVGPRATELKNSIKKKIEERKLAKKLPKLIEVKGSNAGDAKNKAKEEERREERFAAIERRMKDAEAKKNSK